MKKPYEAPEVTIYGSVEDITQFSIEPGSGDEWALFENHLCPYGGCDSGGGDLSG